MARAYIQVRPKVHRGKAGFSIVGTDALGRSGLSIFVQTRAGADRVAAVYRQRVDETDRAAAEAYRQETDHVVKEVFAEEGGALARGKRRGRGGGRRTPIAMVVAKREPAGTTLLLPRYSYATRQPDPPNRSYVVARFTDETGIEYRVQTNKKGTTWWASASKKDRRWSDTLRTTSKAKGEAWRAAVEAGRVGMAKED